MTQTIVSPLAGLLPRGRTTDVVLANEAAFREVPKVQGLLQYVIVNPLQPKTYEQARRMLKAPWCVGIGEVHPEEHGYRIADHGEELFAFFEVALQRVRIEAAEITDEAKRMILYENAARFFNLGTNAQPSTGGS